MKSLAHLLIVAFLATAASAKPNVAAWNEAQYRAYESITFTSVERGWVSRLDGSEKLGVTRLWTRNFHLYRQLSEWKQLAPSALEAIAKVLRHRIEEEVAAYRTAGDSEVVQLHSFCIPRPGIAVKLQTDQGPRDFLICLDSGDVMGFRGARVAVDFSIGDGLKSTFETVGMGSKPKKDRLNTSTRADAHDSSNSGGAHPFSTPSPTQGSAAHR